MKIKSLLSCCLVLAALSRAAALFAEEVKEKDFDDGNGGHQTAIWVDGRPMFYSDFVKEHPPKKGVPKTPPPTDPAAPVPSASEEAPSSGDRSPAGEGPSSGSGPAAAAGKAQASAAAAAGAGQAKTSARASSSMSRMADAMKSMLPKDPGARAAPGPKGASADVKGAGPVAGARSAAGGPSFGRVAPESRTSVAPSAPATGSPRALERRPDFFKVVSPEKYNELKNAYVLTGGSAQPGFQDIGSTGRDFVWTKSCTKGLEQCNPEAAGKEEIHYDKNAIVSPETLKNIASEIEKKPPEEDLSTEEVARIYAAMRAKVAAMEEADSEGQGVLKAKAPAPPAPLSSGETMEFDTGRPPSRPVAEGIGPVVTAAERHVNVTNVIKGLFTSAPPEANGDMAGTSGRGTGWGYLLLAAAATGALVLFVIRRQGRRQRSVTVDR